MAVPSPIRIMRLPVPGNWTSIHDCARCSGSPATWSSTLRCCTCTTEGVTRTPSSQAAMAEDNRFDGTKAPARSIPCVCRASQQEVPELPGPPTSRYARAKRPAASNNRLPDNDEVRCDHSVEISISLQRGCGYPRLSSPAVRTRRSSMGDRASEQGCRLGRSRRARMRSPCYRPGPAVSTGWTVGLHGRKGHRPASADQAPTAVMWPSPRAVRVISAYAPSGRPCVLTCHGCVSGMSASIGAASLRRGDLARTTPPMRSNSGTGSVNRYAHRTSRPLAEARRRSCRAASVSPHGAPMRRRRQHEVAAGIHPLHQRHGRIADPSGQGRRSE